MPHHVKRGWARVAMKFKKVIYIAAPILAWAITVFVVFLVSKNLSQVGLPRELQLPYEVNPPELPKLFVVQSGSMEPFLKLGSLVIVKPQESYAANDIVTFSPEGGKETITHRIAMRRYPEGTTFQPTYITKGDANEEIDRGEVKNENVVGKVILSVPFLGYGVDFAKKPYGFILLVIVPATIIVYEEIRSLLLQLWQAVKKIKIRKKERAPLPKASILIPSIGAFLIFVGISGAYFFDIEESLGNILGAATDFGEPAPSPPAPGKIVINEVYYQVAAGHQIGDEEDWEWVELYNSGGSSVSLENWSIADNFSCDNIPGTPSIPAGAFAIITFQTEANFETIWTLVPDGTLYIQLGSDIGNGLANDDELILRSGPCPDGASVDHISWGGDASAFTPSIPAVAADGISSERNPNGIDTNTNADFVNQSPTPGT